jgi:small subunit ribosomal protein S20
MAKIKSQKKRIITNERNRQKNMAVNSRLKTIVKQAEAAIDSKDAEKVKSAVSTAISVIDKAVTKGVIHKNTAARKKSSLQGRVAKA